MDIEGYNRPTITVVIPAYNIRPYIGAAIDSVVKQSVPVDELIVVNDGSTDETKDIIDEYAIRYPQMIVFHEHNRGLCGARNFGLDHTTSDYVLFLDGDDLLAKDAIANLHKTLSHYRPDLIQGMKTTFRAAKHNIPKSYQLLCSRRRMVSIDQCPELFTARSIPAKLLKVDFLQKNNIRFFDNLMMTEDHFFSNECYLKSTNILIENYVIYNYRQEDPFSSTLRARLSHYKDMYLVQESQKDNFNKELRTQYQALFLNYDFFEFGVNRLLTLSQKEQKEALSWLNKTLNFISPDADALVNGKLKIKLIESLRKEKYLKFYTIFIVSSQFKKVYKFCKKFYKTIINLPFVTKIRRRAYWGYLANQRHLYRVLKLFPVKNNRVLFAVRPKGGMKFFQGIYEQIVKITELEAFILNKKRSGILDDLRALYHIARSRVVLLDNHYGPIFGIKTRKSTTVIQCWHAGGAFKKFGVTRHDPRDAAKIKRDQYEHSSYSYFLTSSPAVNKMYAAAFDKSLDKALPLGAPKSDQLYKVRNELDKVKNTFINNYLQINGRKVILYAPTFRDADLKNLHSFNFRIILNQFVERFKDKYVLALRLHPHLVAIQSIADNDNLIVVSTYPEAELLACADALITDYSSIIFDYAFFKKPMFFYAYDLEKYYVERGFYEPYPQFVPGPICRTQEQLFDAIEDIPEFSQKSENFWNTYMTACDGRVCEKVAEFVKSKVREK